jgi:hypothetical protein
MSSIEQKEVRPTWHAPPLVTLHDHYRQISLVHKAAGSERMRRQDHKEPKGASTLPTATLMKDCIAGSPRKSCKGRPQLGIEK